MTNKLKSAETILGIIVSVLVLAGIFTAYSIATEKRLATMEQWIKTQDTCTVELKEDIKELRTVLVEVRDMIRYHLALHELEERGTRDGSALQGPGIENRVSDSPPGSEDALGQSRARGPNALQ